MTRILLRFALLSITVLFLLGSVEPIDLHAVEEQKSFNEWLADLRGEALADGISEETINSAFTGLEPIPRIIKLDRNQPEFKRTLDEYLHRTVSKKRIAMGRKMLRENRVLLTDISKRYGVQPRFLLALWGIESDFGLITGDFPVMSALATLAYDGRRSTYFRQECLYALRILDEGLLVLEQMKGSWAGAMGQLQFMPSTFYSFAVDYDGNEKINIWKSRGDIFASAANYLFQSGWKQTQTWGREVRLSANFNQSLAGLQHRKRLSQWQALGVRCVTNQEQALQDWPGSIILPDGPTGKAYLVFSNFHVILKWNRAYNFAVAVGILSDRIGSSKT